jgi:hypothetical protein
MTAEIAVMNEEAIALAADSAVSGPKIFTSANKIFALSKYHPVGVMVFASAQFLNVPWETIIKQYRRDLGDRSFPTLAEHADHFVDYFNGPNRLFPPDAQERSIATVAEALCETVMQDANPRLRARAAAGEELDESDVVAEIEQSINAQSERWKKAGRREDVPKTYRATIGKKYSPQIEETISRVTEGANVSESALKTLVQSVPWYLDCADFLWRNSFNSGIVIAGFGSEDVFPRLRRFQFQTIAANRLKFAEVENFEIGHHSRAIISAFAQDREVRTFMNGVDPKIAGHLKTWWPQKLYDVVDQVGETLQLDETEQAQLLENMTERCFEVFDEYEQELLQFQQEQNIEPILSIVAMLPKDELAAMAESLVNLASFKRRVTDEEETVGGPIDVAVISRGDGFIWIQRKHYFKPELNPQFLANYYRSEEDNEQDQ